MSSFTAPLVSFTLLLRDSVKQVLCVRRGCLRAAGACLLHQVPREGGGAEVLRRPRLDPVHVHHVLSIHKRRDPEAHRKAQLRHLG
jgi:hypothetical protein